MSTLKLVYAHSARRAPIDAPRVISGDPAIAYGNGAFPGDSARSIKLTVRRDVA